MSENENAGFTLIELLVVVLIIGILAAIALPQYQVAVTKSKLAKCMSLARILGDAEERYYMANGEYALYFSDLDVSIPEGYTHIVDPSGEWSQTAYYKDFSVLPKSLEKLSYCNVSGIWYGWRLSQSGEGYQNICSASKKGMPLTEKVCKSFGGIKYAENDTNIYYGW